MREADNKYSRESKNTSREQTRLKELSNSPMSGVALVVVEPIVFFLSQSGHHSLYVLLVSLLFILYNEKNY